MVQILGGDVAGFVEESKSSKVPTDVIIICVIRIHLLLSRMTAVEF